MIHVISDTHFGNANIIKYCNRPFVDVDDQTEKLIANWNGAVNCDDEVIVVGDFFMGDPANIDNILPRLNGHITLVRGNHDTQRKLDIYDRDYSDKVSVRDIHYVPYKGLFFVFCHFPIVHDEFARMVIQDNSEVVWVSGHVHDKCPFYNQQTHSFNVSVDVIDFTPVPLHKMWQTVRDDFESKGVWKGV